MESPEERAAQPSPAAPRDSHFRRLFARFAEERDDEQPRYVECDQKRSEESDGENQTVLLKRHEQNGVFTEKIR